MAKQDAIALIESDHQKMRRLFEDLLGTTEEEGDRRQTLLAELGVEYEAHSAFEEELFYPAVREAIGDGREADLMFFESLAAHAAIDLLMPDLEKTPVDTIEFAAKTKILRDVLEAHLVDEETRMLTRAREVCSTESLEELGAKIYEHKQETLRKAGFLGEEEGRATG